MGYQPINKVPELLSMADLVVLPSISGYESIGQIPAKIFDAMAMEKPIIASNTSDLPIILNGCGIIVSNENIDDLSKNIEIVLNNPYFALELGKKARKKFLDEYSLNVIEEKLLYLVERVMDKNRNENL
jgi:glycosyltransferase involved in cell wall biosynthesis